MRREIAGAANVTILSLHRAFNGVILEIFHAIFGARNLAADRLKDRIMSIMAAGENSSLATRPSLLNRLKGSDDVPGWQDFYRLYGPLIRNFARKAGLTEDEAEEVVQEAAVSVARNLPGY